MVAQYHAHVLRRPYALQKLHAVFPAVYNVPQYIKRILIRQLNLFHYCVEPAPAAVYIAHNVYHARKFLRCRACNFSKARHRLQAVAGGLFCGIIISAFWQNENNARFNYNER